jgi:NAD(P)H-hydrate epimerase
MEAAGGAVADQVMRHWSPRRLLVLCGPGNNGGDGLVAARHLAAAGWPVRVALLGHREHLSGDAALNAAAWTGAVEPATPDRLDEVDLVIDALFGSGLSRPLAGAAAALVAGLIARALPVCAVDVPSGVDGASGAVLGSAAPAQLTVSFFRKKPGHLLLPGRQLCGTLVIADIGIPDQVLETVRPLAWENGPALWLPHFPWPGPESHKYRRGELLLLGGASTTGASRLTARAAQRVGAGLVTLAAPPESWMIYALALEGVIVRQIQSSADFAALLADPRRNAVAIGPGAGIGADTRQNVLAALDGGQRAVVIDADGLTSFAEDPALLFRAITPHTVLTPHHGEFDRLFRLAGDKLQISRAGAAASHAVLLLKGSDTVIATPDGRAIINSNAPPTLATGGSGDVLTGLIAGLMAQGMPPCHAAAAGAWLHGAAANAFGPGLIASDLPDAVPGVLRQLASTVV